MIGLGVDAVNIKRFGLALRRTPTIRKRIFTAEELESVNTQASEVASLAARFAVREATMKALGVGLGQIDLHDVSIRSQKSGAPELVVVGRAEELARKQGVRSWRVSITHTDEIAIAVVASS